MAFSGLPSNKHKPPDRRDSEQKHKHNYRDDNQATKPGNGAKALLGMAQNRRKPHAEEQQPANKEGQDKIEKVDQEGK
jgi:hypothetical protein